VGANLLQPEVIVGLKTRNSTDSTVNHKLDDSGYPIPSKVEDLDEFLKLGLGYDPEYDTVAHELSRCCAAGRVDDSHIADRIQSFFGDNVANQAKSRELSRRLFQLLVRQYPKMSEKLKELAPWPL